MTEEQAQYVTSKYQAFQEIREHNGLNISTEELFYRLADLPKTSYLNRKVKGFNIAPELDELIDTIGDLTKKRGIKSDIMNEALRRYFKDLGIEKDQRKKLSK